MAQINLQDIERVDKTRNTVHEKVHASYTVFEVDGEKYVQLDTYGRAGRENPEKISQSIQFNLETAKYIADSLKKEFGL